jgi:tetratricopeptide (TPR) repeat protein
MSAFRERGRILFFNHGRYEQAEKEFLRALADNPDDTEAHALRGLTLIRMNRFNEAIAACQEAIRLAPEWSYAHYALSYVLLMQSHLEEAGKAAQEGIRINPHTAYLHSHLAVILHRLGRYDDALASADEGLRCDGQHVDSLNSRSMALAALQRLEDAEQTSRIALALEPENSATLGKLGYILLKREKAFEALEVLREALRLDPSLTWSKEVRADVLTLLVQQGRWREVWQLLPDDLFRDPEEEAHCGRIGKALTSNFARWLSAPLGLVWFGVCLATLGLTGHLEMLPWLIPVLGVQLVSFPFDFVLAEPAVRLAFLATARNRLMVGHDQRVGLKILGALIVLWILFAVLTWATLSPRLAAIMMLVQAMMLPTVAMFNATMGVSRVCMFLFATLIAFGCLLSFLCGMPKEWPSGSVRLVDVTYLLGTCGTGPLYRLSRWLHKVIPGHWLYIA